MLEKARNFPMAYMFSGSPYVLRIGKGIWGLKSEITSLRKRQLW
jgi:hypothetical protein